VTIVYSQEVDEYVIKLSKSLSLNTRSIALIAGISVETCRAIRQEAGTVGRPTRGNVVFESKIHQRIGVRLKDTLALMEQKKPDDRIKALGWSKLKYNRVIRGEYLLTIVDLENMAQIFQCSVTNVVNGKFGLY